MVLSEWEKILSYLRSVREVSFDEHAYPINEEEGLIIYSLTFLVSSKFNSLKVFEAGSGVGYSTLWFLLALKEVGSGLIYAVDRSERKIGKLISHVRKLGLENYLKTIVGDAVEVAKEVEEDFLIVFIDIEKHRYIELFKAVEDKVVPGGLVLAHNAWMASSYVKWIKNRNGWKTIVVPSTGGLVLTVKQNIATGYYYYG